jgi:hypothetical protein
MTVKPDSAQIKNNSLLIVPPEEKKLSQHQLLFNNLITKIEILNDRLKIEKQKLDKLSTYFKKMISPHRSRVAWLQIEVAKEFANSLDALKFGSVQKKEIEKVIIWLCEQAFAEIEPDKDLKSFYDQWSPKKYDEILMEKELKVRESMADDLFFNFGIELDLSEFDYSKEGFARLKNKVREEVDKQAKERDEKNKSKREIARALRLKNQEDLKQKNIRSVYVSLAKMLHPDTVRDENEKSAREELMKKVTVAYNEKNLSELLKLEVQWVTSEKNHVEDLPEEKLQLYIINLQEQASQLEGELDLLSKSPKYAGVAEYSHFAEKTAIRKIKELSRLFEDNILRMDHILRNLRRNQTKKTVLDYFREFEMLMNYQEGDYE